MTKPRSVWDWNTGEPSIFLKGKGKEKFNGADTQRAVNQTRLEPRPTYLTSDSVYLKMPKLVRKIK